jgi:DNA-binding transcriptional MocR family regulator
VTTPGGPRIKGYADLAALFRHRILDGVIQPGHRLPAEPDLMAQFGLARETVRRAMKMLRAEGLAQHVPGWGTVVRETRPVEEILLEPGASVQARPPTADERERFDIGEGVAVLVVSYPDGSGDLYPGDRYRLRVD